MKDDFFVVSMHYICAECCKDLDAPDELFWLPHLWTPGMGDYDMVSPQ